MPTLMYQLEVTENNLKFRNTNMSKHRLLKKYIRFDTNSIQIYI